MCTHTAHAQRAEKLKFHDKNTNLIFKVVRSLKLSTPK